MIMYIDKEIMSPVLFCTLIPPSSADFNGPDRASFSTRDEACDRMSSKSCVYHEGQNFIETVNR